jgi:4-oxalocrotonate tautomerase
VPFIHVQLFEGRTVEQKRAFVEVVTKEAVRTLSCAAEDVEVVFDEIKKSNWATAGRLHSDPK